MWQKQLYDGEPLGKAVKLDSGSKENVLCGKSDAGASSSR